MDNHLCGLVVRVLATEPEVLGLPDCLRSSGSGMGSTQPCEYKRVVVPQSIYIARSQTKATVFSFSLYG
jgi:hypothetical protein